MQPPAERIGKVRRLLQSAHHEAFVTPHDEGFAGQRIAVFAQPHTPASTQVQFTPVLYKHARMTAHLCLSDSLFCDATFAVKIYSDQRMLFVMPDNKTEQANIARISRVYAALAI